jgi:hypothetical protein
MKNIFLLSNEKYFSVLEYIQTNKNTDENPDLPMYFKISRKPNVQGFSHLFGIAKKESRTLGKKTVD